MNVIKPIEKYPIKLFIASGAETKEIRKNIVFELNTLNDVYEKSDFRFDPVIWEAQSAAWAGRSQNEYNEKISNCQMVAVVVKNTLGRFTKEEFEDARKKFEKNGSPKVVVYTLPSNSDDKARNRFVNSFNKKGAEYFRCKVDNEDQLIGKIKEELLRIKNDFAPSIEGAEETVKRLDLKGGLTEEAVKLFEAGDVAKANAALPVEKIIEQDEELKAPRTEIAEAYVLKAKLELTTVTNPDRFKIAEELFEKAVGVIRAPKILFEYAYFCQQQNIFNKAIALFKETLELYREVGNISNVAVTLNNLGNLHSDNGDCEKAEEEYNQALKLERKLAKDNPDVHEPNVAMTLNNLGNLHKNTGNCKQAEIEYNEAFKLYRKFNDDYKIAIALNNLGNLHNENGDYKKAEAEYNEALRLFRELAEDNPAIYEPKAAVTLHNLGNLYNVNGDYKQAEDEYNKALELYRKFAESNPDVYEPYVAGTLYNFALLHVKIKDYKKSEKENIEALELITPYYEAYPDVHGKLYGMITRGLAELEGLTVK